MAIATLFQKQPEKIHDFGVCSGCFAWSCFRHTASHNTAPAVPILPECVVMRLQEIVQHPHSTTPAVIIFWWLVKGLWLL